MGNVAFFGQKSVLMVSVGMVTMVLKRTVDCYLDPDVVTASARPAV